MRKPSCGRSYRGHFTAPVTHNAKLPQDVKKADSLPEYALNELKRVQKANGNGYIGESPDVRSGMKLPKLPDHMGCLNFGFN